MNKYGQLKKKELNLKRHAFLLTFFNQEIEHYEAKLINGFYLVKQWNASTKRWEVAIWDKETYSRIHTTPLDTATDVSSF